MSSIDLNNPQVLKNWLTSQMKEGKGEFVYKEKVLVFKGRDSSEYLVPDSMVQEIELARKLAAPSEPAPSEPAPSEPAPSEPAPSEPAPSEPAPSEPAPSEPAPSEPAPSVGEIPKTPRGRGGRSRIEA